MGQGEVGGHSPGQSSRLAGKHPELRRTDTSLGALTKRHELTLQLLLCCGGGMDLASLRTG